MEMTVIEQITKIIMENGVSVGVLIYFMYYNHTQMKEMKSAIQEQTKVLHGISLFFQKFGITVEGDKRE